MLRYPAPESTAATTGEHVTSVLFRCSNLKVVRTATCAYVAPVAQQLARVECDTSLEFKDQAMDTSTTHEAVAVTVTGSSPQPTACRQVANDLSHETFLRRTTRAVPFDETSPSSAMAEMRLDNLAASTFTRPSSRGFDIRVFAMPVADDETSRWLQDATRSVALDGRKRSSAATSADCHPTLKWRSRVLDGPVAGVRAERAAFYQRPCAVEHHTAAFARPRLSCRSVSAFSTAPLDHALGEDGTSYPKQFAAETALDSNTLISHRWLSPSVSRPSASEPRARAKCCLQCTCRRLRDG